MNARAPNLSASTKWLWLLLLWALPAAAQAQFYYTNSYGIWSYTSNTGPVTITGLTNIALNGTVVIPDTINGYPVTSIGNSAFVNLKGLTNVAMGTNLTSIGNFAFQACLGLRNAAIGSNVANIGFFAFEDDFNLTNGTIPDSVTNIANNAFYSCFDLTNVTIGSGAMSIGTSVFADCSSLISISVDPANPDFSSAAGVLFNKSQTTLLEYPGGKAGSYSVPGGVTSIGGVAFQFCSGLTGVTIPGSVTSIASAALADCPSLTNIAISASVTSIGLSAFEGCPSLIAITVDPANPAYSSAAGVFFDKAKTTLIQYPTGKSGSYTIPYGVTSIESEAFNQCLGLTGVTIPDSVIGIGELAFIQCTNLTTLTIPDSVNSIGDSAFDFCTRLTNVIIGSSVAHIASDAFDECTALLRIDFRGNAPSPTNDATVFSGDPANIFYLPGTVGWSPIFDSKPTAFWALPEPEVLAKENPGFGVQGNGFGFTISWDTNASVVVEACTNLVNPVWSPVSTNALSSGTNYFSDPQWTNYPSRFYRLSWQ